MIVENKLFGFIFSTLSLFLSPHGNYVSNLEPGIDTAEPESKCLYKLVPDGARLELSKRGKCGDNDDEEEQIENQLREFIGLGNYLKKYDTFYIGPIDELKWRDRISDCFSKKYGFDNRSIPIRLPQSVELLNRCDIFPELQAVFYQFGINIEIDSIEDVTEIDLARSNKKADQSASDSWVMAHRGHRGLIPNSALVWFSMHPNKISTNDHR